MLKLEKTASGHTITVSLRHKEPLLSGAFLKALMMAVLLHAGGLLLFKIHMIHRDKNEWAVINPRLVDSDMGHSNRSLITTGRFWGEGDGSLSFRPVSMPQMQSPKFPDPPSVTADQRFNLEAVLMHYEFPKKLQERFQYQAGTPSLSFIAEEDLITIHISGALALRAIIDDGLDVIKKLKELEDVEEGMLTYQVKVEDRSGKIIWFLRDGLQEVGLKDRIASEIIQNMRFERILTEQPLVTAGTVEIMFRSRI
jgi:hypothetical protein